MDLDLNLLRLLDAMFVHRNVSAAARALNLSQPTASLALRRLRQHFGDELFVRQGGEMAPTAAAEQLRGPVERVMTTVRAEIVGAGPFEPATSDRSFTISLSDIGELTFLPDLIALLRERAPSVAIQSVPLPPNELQKALAEGSVDLALGYFLDLPGENIFTQTLFDQGFVCLARADHPSIGSRLSLDQFFDADHAVVEQTGRSQEVFERKVRALGSERRVVLRSPHFMSVPFLVAQSDMITTVPLAVGRIFARLANLKILKIPFDVPKVPLQQFWHRRAQGDPGSLWLRKMVAELYLGRDPTRGWNSPFWARFASTAAEGSGLATTPTRALRASQPTTGGARTGERGRLGQTEDQSS